MTEVRIGDTVTIGRVEKSAKTIKPVRSCDVDENGWCHTNNCYMSNCPITCRKYN